MSDDPTQGWPPQQPYPAAQPVVPPKKSRAGLISLLVVAGVILLVGAVVTTVLLVRSESPAEASEVFLDSATEPGPDPFSTSISNTALPPKTSGTTTLSAAPQPPAGAITATSGGTPGLYGGTNDLKTCDKGQLVAFLEANPDKARAWVLALNADSSLRWSGGNRVDVGQIRSYVDELTSITLVRDTRVTNYGYANGQPTPRQAVLQAGTAVLVDAYGVPRTKCACGNPLTKPTAVVNVRYTGPQWVGWSPTTIVVVQQTTVVINTYILTNVDTGGQFSRPAGTSGDDDGPVDRGGSTTSSSSSTTSTSPPSSGPTSSSTTATTGRSSTTSATTGSGGPLPADFCATYKGIEARSRSGSPDPQAVLADFEKMAQSAPADLREDLELLISWVKQGIALGRLDVFNIPDAVAAANQRLETAITSRCG